MPKVKRLPPELEKFRDLLVEYDHQASIGFDRAVMTLSGGALGISVSFLHDVVASPLPGTKIFLAISWSAFAVSLTSILISYLTSMESLRTTIKEVDDGTIYLKKKPGGTPTWVTETLRITAAAGFLVGVVLFLIFALNNF